MALILQTGAKIDETGLTDAFTETDDTVRYFLDTLTGDVGCVEGVIPPPLVLQDGRYIEVPRIEKGREVVWLSEMIHECMDPKKDEALIQELSAVIESASERGDVETIIECEAILEKEGKKWINAWDHWSSAPLWDEIESWLATLPIPIEDQFEGCGECDLCELLDDGPHTLGDFLEAKQKAERKKRKE